MQLLLLSPSQPALAALAPVQVMGLTTAIGVLQGTNSPMFAISLVFSLIVSHAALLWHSCQRLQHGRQAALAVGAAGATVVGRPSMQLCAGSSCYTHLLLPPPLNCTAPFPPCQVMYDASGVRLHAGKQASVLNMIITELPPDHPVSNSAGAWPSPQALIAFHCQPSLSCSFAFCCRPALGASSAVPCCSRPVPCCLPRLVGTLKDTLGHTPLQVAVGAVVGVLTGYLTALLYL